MSPEFGPKQLTHRSGAQAPAPIYAEIMPSSGGDEEERAGMSHYWKLLFRKKWLILLAGAIGATLGYLAVIPQTPIYRSSASLEVLEVNSSFLNLKSLDPTVEHYSLETRIHTEMKMLQSQSLVRQVEEQMILTGTPLAPPPPDPVTTFLSNLGMPPLRTPPTRLAAVKMAATTLQIRNQDLTRILEISCESTDPKTASDFANALIQGYISSTVDSRLDNAQRTKEWLDRQIEEVRQKLEQTNTHLVEYAQSAGLTLGTESTDKLKKLQDGLSTAQSDMIRREVELRAATTADPSSLAENEFDQELRILRSELVKSETELGKLRTTYASEHYRVQRLEAQIKDLKEQINTAAKRVVQRLQNDYDKATAFYKVQKQYYEDQAKLVSEQDRKMIRHNMLQREVETYRQLYDTMLQRVKEASIASAMRASNVRLVDKAEPSKKPYKPQPVRNVLTGLITGLFLAMSLVIVRSTTDRRFKLPGEASSYLQVRELGSIPRAEAIPARRGTRLLGMGRKEPDVNPDMSDLVTWSQSPSPQAESFRSVLVSLLSTAVSHRGLVVTSPNQAEGKTTVVSNLGVALTEVGKRVLVIDGDLRRPRLHDIFGIPNGWGFTDIVNGEFSISLCPIDYLVRATEVPGLFVLPSGPSAPNTARVLYSNRTQELLQRLQQEFDVILVDTPPVLLYPDARIFARWTGGAVVVLRAEVTERSTGKQAVDVLEEDGIPVLGVILNDWHPGKEAEGRYSRYSRYSAT